MSWGSSEIPALMSSLLPQHTWSWLTLQQRLVENLTNLGVGMVGAGAREGSGDVTSLKLPWRALADPLRPLLADHSEPSPFLFPHCSAPSQASGPASETPSCSQTVSEASDWLSVACPAWTVPVLSPPHPQLATCSWGPQPAAPVHTGTGIWHRDSGFSRGHGSSWGTSASPNPQPSPFGLTEDRTQFSE